MRRTYKEVNVKCMLSFLRTKFNIRKCRCKIGVKCQNELGDLKASLESEALHSGHRVFKNLGTSYTLKMKFFPVGGEHINGLFV